MGPRRLSTFAVAAVIAACASLFGTAAPAAAADRVAFQGRCDIYGDVTFRDLVTTTATQNPFRFLTADRLTTCAGTLTRGERTLIDGTWPARITVDGTGSVSCQRSTVGGPGTLEALVPAGDGFVRKTFVEGDRRLVAGVQIDSSIEHVLNSVVATLAGGDGSTGVARATFLPTPEAITACGQQGIRSLPFNGTVIPNGSLVSTRDIIDPDSPKVKNALRLKARLARKRVRTRTAARLRLELSEPARVTVKVRRARGAKLVRTVERKLAEGTQELSVSTGGLRPGRYRVVVFAETDGRFSEERSLRLVVRRAGGGVKRASTAATGEVKFCGKRDGWQVAAGNFDPEFPLTDCPFAQLTFTTVNNRKGRLPNLKKRFSATVGGFALACTARSPKGYAEFRCRDAEHFVLAYRFG